MNRLINHFTASSHASRCYLHPKDMETWTQQDGTAGSQWWGQDKPGASSIHLTLPACRAGNWQIDMWVPVAFRGNLGNSHPGNIVSRKNILQIPNKRQEEVENTTMGKKRVLSTVFRLETEAMQLTHSLKGPGGPAIQVTDRQDAPYSLGISRG